MPVEAHCRSLAFPGFPVESCGFSQLRGRATSVVAGESREAGNPGTLGMTKKERTVGRKGRLLEERAVAGQFRRSLGMTKKRGPLEGRAVAGGKGGCWTIVGPNGLQERRRLDDDFGTQTKGYAS
jgi:hypothetical protein